MIAVVLAFLGSATRNFEKYIGRMGIKIDLHTVQKPHYWGQQEY